jgi:hypothetical protein
MMHSLESRASRRPVSFHQYNDTSAAALEEAIDEITYVLCCRHTPGLHVLDLTCVCPPPSFSASFPLLYFLHAVVCLFFPIPFLS